jgi:cyanophycinase
MPSSKPGPAAMRSQALVTALIIVLPACQSSQVNQASQLPAVPIAPAGFGAPFKPRPPGTGGIKVGPPRGTLIVVGGGGQIPEVYKAFIDAAGGPDALILIVPNASGAETVSANAGQGWRNNGAKNVAVLFTQDRRIADSDSFTALIGKAGGVWFDGGRHWRIVQDYGGTKTERAFNDVLDRGGVIGGSSAGASIQGDYFVRGAPSNNNVIMGYPGWETGFGYLKNVGIDQHVVARSRLPDLADSIIPRYPTLLGISEDEGTAWVIRGDTGRIIGRSKGFVYNGRENDADSPFLTLRPGDTYDLNARRVISRAYDRSPVKLDLINDIFAKYNDPAAGGATVLVAQDGDVFINHAYGIAAQTRYLPRTTLPLFQLGEIAKVFTELCASAPLPPPPAPQSCVARVARDVGAVKTAAAGADPQHMQSSVDELYRVARGLDFPTTWPNADYTRGWTTDSYRGVTRMAAYGAIDGKRAAFVRIPERRATIIILTNDPSADARGMAERILDQLIREFVRIGAPRRYAILTGCRTNADRRLCSAHQSH